jgi:hypothetical protein
VTLLAHTTHWAGYVFAIVAVVGLVVYDVVRRRRARE